MPGLVQVRSCFRRENYSTKYTKGQTPNNKRQVIKMGNSEKYDVAYLMSCLMSLFATSYGVRPCKYKNKNIGTFI